MNKKYVIFLSILVFLIVAISAFFLIYDGESFSKKESDFDSWNNESLKSNDSKINDSNSTDSEISENKQKSENKQTLKNKKTNETVFKMTPLMKNEAIKLAKNEIHLDPGLIFGNNAYEWPGGAWQIYVYNKTTGEIVDFYIIGQYGTI
ncbi:MAG: hypothetical protein LBM96_00955, partial [Methanobrevibacter sp.]|nr:hypothetical protein [Candidatus Methanoflexus mossambicus]